MNLFELLGKFKTIKPDASFTEKSKRAILAMPQNIPARRFGGILQFIETGAAVVLAGFFILLIGGAFSNSPYVAPVQYSVIDAAGLHAEAQAIDMQIQLANVNYPETAPQASTPSTAATVKPSSLSTAMTAATSSAPSVASGTTALSAGNSTATSTATSTNSVDQALRALSQ